MDRTLTAVSGENPWDRLVLPANIKARLQAACGDPRTAPSILLYGPPGTGKNEVGRTIARTGIGFVATTFADLRGSFIGQSAAKTRQLLERARAMAPAVLFIDELDAVAPGREPGDRDPISSEIITELLAHMDANARSQRPVLILATALAAERLDPALRARFAQQIEIPLPDEGARRQMVRDLLIRSPIEAGLDIDDLAADVAKHTNGCSGRDVTNLVSRAAQEAATRAATVFDVTLTRALIMEQLPRSS